MPIQPELRYDELLDAAVQAVPDRDAVVFLADDEPPLRWTYGSVAERVDQAARALLASGISRGRVIACYAPNRPEFVLLQFACARIGAAIVPVSPAATAVELEYVLARSKAEICFTVDRHRSVALSENLAQASSALPALRVRVALTNGCVGTDADWVQWLAGGGAVGEDELVATREAVTAADVAMIQFTSGTTGRPKGVRLRSSSLANAGRCTAERAGLEDGCRYLHAMPFCHVGGSVTAFATTVAKAGTQLLQPSFSAAALAAAVDSEAATAILAVPTMLIALAERATADGRRFTSLRTVLTGGSLVPESVARHWIDTYDVEIANTYGMTEFSGPAIMSGPSDPLERVLLSVGRPLPGVEVEVVEVGGHERRRFGEDGEVRFRGWGVMDG